MCPQLKLGSKYFVYFIHKLQLSSDIYYFLIKCVALFGKTINSQ